MPGLGLVGMCGNVQSVCCRIIAVCRPLPDFILQPWIWEWPGDETRQVTRAVRSVSLRVDKNPVPSPNRRDLDGTRFRLVCCPYRLTALLHRPARQYSGKQYAQLTRSLPGHVHCPGLPGSGIAYAAKTILR